MNAEELDIGNNKYRVRLFNCASDIPATRAAMGLSGHSAKQGNKSLNCLSVVSIQ